MSKQIFKKNVIRTYTNAQSSDNDKIDTSFLIDKPIYDYKNTENDLNSILFEDLNEVNDELNKLKNDSNFKIEEDDMYFSFNDSLLLDDVNQPPFSNRKIIEDDILNDNQFFDISESNNSIISKRKNKDQSIYDDIKELEILYSTFKKENKR